MSIFDSVMGNMSSFSDAASTIFDAAGLGKPSKASTSDSLSSSNRMFDALRAGQMSLPYSQGSEFKAAKTKAAEQVDPESINQAWLRRLSRYSEIAQETGVKR